MENSQHLEANIEQVQSRGDACVPDAQLHLDSADAAADATQLVNVEQVFIKGEPVEEITDDTESYGNILDSISKKEYINDNINCNDDQIKDYNNPSTIRGTRKTSTTNIYCFLCKKTFSKKSNLKIHMKIHERTKDFHCELCKESFELKIQLKGHMATCHPVEKEFHCTVCKKIFKRKDHLIGHMRSHSGKKEFECHICHKLFKQNDTLKLHMKLHNGIKFQCSMCPKQFTYSFNLKNHLKIHNGIKNYKCTECNKEFTQKGHLKTHMLTHSGKREFECSVCKKLFSRNENLRRHLRIHRCSVCDKTSKRKCDHKRIKKINSRTSSPENLPQEDRPKITHMEN